MALGAIVGAIGVVALAAPAAAQGGGEVPASDRGDPDPAPTPDQRTAAGKRSEAEKQAETLFEEGLELFQEGRFSAACARLRASLMVFPGTGTRGKLAECYEKLGLPASAHRLYLEVERLAREAEDTYRASIARERYRALEDHIPRLTIRPGPSVTLPGFRVSVDSDVLEPSSLGIGVFVDPGTHEVTAWAAGHETWSFTVAVDVDDVITIGVPALEPIGSAGSGSRALRITGWVLLGAGGAALAGAGYFGFRAIRARDRLVEACPGYADPDAALCPGSAARQHYDDASTSADRANIAAVVAAGAVVTGGLLVWLNRRSRPAEPTLAAEIVPVVTGNSATVQISYPF